MARLRTRPERVSQHQSENILSYYYDGNWVGSPRKSELIQIGKTFYCRENGGRWKKSREWCGPV